MADKLLSELAKGSWQSGSSYTPGDIVDNDGSSYVCIANSTNNEPPNATYWALLAQKGQDGDIVGPDSAVNNNLAAFDTTTGKLIKDSGYDPTDFDAAGAAAGVQSNLTTHEGNTSAHGVSGDVVGTTDTQTLTSKTLTSPVINTGVSGTAVKDEDDMASDSATALATQQSIKAYVDTRDGWQPATDTWTYASATTFTIAGVDRTAIFTSGTKIKLTQTTAKYFYVVGSAFSTNTTVTVTGGTDYTLANAAITLPNYSYASNPQGFPHLFAYTPAWTAESVNPAIGDGAIVGRFSINGKIVVTQISMTTGASSTYGTGTYYFSLPVNRYANVPSFQVVGNALIYDSNTTTFYMSACQWGGADATKVRLVTAGAGSIVSPTVPMTFAQSDEVRLTITYPMV